jgi:hypothetical protein
MYAIHCPPLAGDSEAAAEAMRARRVGFSYAGFVFGPFWLLAHRLWGFALAYVVAAALIGFLVDAGVFGAGAAVALELLAAVLIGLEGRNWVGAALTRRGSPLVDIVEAHDADEAARVFFTRALANPAAPRQRTAFPIPALARSREIIGLFPEAPRS